MSPTDLKELEEEKEKSSYSGGSDNELEQTERKNSDE